MEGGGLRPLFCPASIAAVGASASPGKAGNAMVRSLLGFRGVLHLVNRTATEIEGRAVASSVRAIGEPVDLAVLVVPLVWGLFGPVTVETHAGPEIQVSAPKPVTYDRAKRLCLSDYDKPHYKWLDRKSIRLQGHPPTPSKREWQFTGTATAKNGQHGDLDCTVKFDRYGNMTSLSGGWTSR